MSQRTRSSAWTQARRVSCTATRPARGFLADRLTHLLGEVAPVEVGAEERRRCLGVLPEKSVEVETGYIAHPAVLARETLLVQDRQVDSPICIGLGGEPPPVPGHDRLTEGERANERKPDHPPADQRKGFSMRTPPIRRPSWRSSVTRRVAPVTLAASTTRASQNESLCRSSSCDAVRISARST